MNKKIGVLAIFSILLMFGLNIITAEEVEKRPIEPWTTTIQPLKVNVSLYCRGPDYIRYQIREVGHGEMVNAQYKWIDGKILGYVEVKGGAKYLGLEMEKLGYSNVQWSYATWRDRLDVLPLGVLSRGCQYRD